mmetsp:Transcript_15508/g.19527  ORF Transcript_15508/g.19527 Transcript_15508/m.19527 type:complete len:88 (-) Transcript_15508:1223-1486(-)
MTRLKAGWLDAEQLKQLDEQLKSQLNRVEPEYLTTAVLEHVLGGANHFQIDAIHKSYDSPAVEEKKADAPLAEESVEKKQDEAIEPE